MREIGQRVGMRYLDDSRAYSENVASCVRSFGYSCTSGVPNFARSTIYDALDERCPVYVDGTRYVEKVQKGHAWIADGYIYSRIGTEYYEERLVNNDEPGLIPHYEYVLTSSTVQTTNLLHYNWGWNGDFNGYFTAVNSCSVGVRTYSEMRMITSIRLARINSDINDHLL